jgi:hypothetical protein
MALFSRFIIKEPGDTALTLGEAQKAAAAASASGAAGAGAASSGAASVKAAAPSTVFVELGEASQQAQIARDGVGVPPIALNTVALQGLLAGRPQLVTKVVSQSVPPGTAVPRGTSIDIVLAEPGGLPIDIIPDPHTALSGRSLANVFDSFIKDSPAVRNVLARNESAATLSTADQGVIQAAFQAQEVPITTQPGQTMQQAFGSLQAAFAFGA